MSGPDARLAALFEEHAPRLFAYARRQVGPAEAEDLVSEAFIVAMNRLEDLPKEPGEAFAWLVGTVRKLAANQRRRLKTQDRHWREAVRQGWHVTGSAEDAFAQRERCLVALASLSATDRELLLLVAWEGLSTDQAATVLGISKNTFSVRLHRARQRLETHIHPAPEPALRAVTPAE
ncbi:MAG: RNA polymerase sigma factor [Microthrixaceae bacterium]